MTTGSQVLRGAARMGCRLTAILTFSVLCANTGSTPAEIRWNELAALLIGRQVSIPVGGRVLVEGEALSVRDQFLMLDIRKTSDPGRYPKGQTQIPRSVITEVRVRNGRGTGGRILGSVVGMLLGMVAGAEIAGHGTDSEAAGVSTFTATAVACTVGGYYVGRTADRSTRVFHIASANRER